MFSWFLKFSGIHCMNMCHAVNSVKIFTNFLFPEFSPSQILKVSGESLACFHELSLSQILKMPSVREFGMFSRTFSFPNSQIVKRERVWHVFTNFLFPKFSPSVRLSLRKMKNFDLSPPQFTFTFTITGNLVMAVECL